MSLLEECSQFLKIYINSYMHLLNRKLEMKPGKSSSAVHNLLHYYSEHAVDLYSPGNHNSYQVSGRVVIGGNFPAALATIPLARCSAPLSGIFCAIGFIWAPFLEDCTRQSLPISCDRRRQDGPSMLREGMRLRSCYVAFNLDGLNCKHCDIVLKVYYNKIRYSIIYRINNKHCDVVRIV